MRRLWVVPSVLAVLVIGALVALMSLTQSTLVPRSNPTSPPSTSNQGNAKAMADGLGDEYYPAAGNAGYDVVHYAIDVTWRPETKTLTGVARIDAVATADFSRFSFDLSLTPTAVKVNGEPKQFQRLDEMNVAVDYSAASGEKFTLEVEYSGDPLAACGDDIVHLDGDELLIAGEPESATCWYPANDHPRDPATFDISIRAPEGAQGVSAGRYRGADDGVHRFQIKTPTPTYTTFLAVGRYEVRTGEAAGRPTYYAVSAELGDQERANAFAELEQSPQYVAALTDIFGPYPADAIGGVAVNERMWFAALETSSNPLYASGAVWRTVIVHELSHMWVGNHVTLERWHDIFLNEAMASYATWVYDERIGETSALERFQQGAKQPAGTFWTSSMRKPSKEMLFGLVYQRGPMAMHALREVMGDEKFFTMWRDWAQAPGARTVEDFIAFAERRHGSSLKAFFEGWLDGKPMPRTIEFGFR